MKHLLSLSVGSSRASSSEFIHFQGKEYRLTHLGVDYDVDMFESILKSYDGKCDAICVSYVPPVVALRKKILMHNLYRLVRDTVKDTPVYFGHHLRAIIGNWTLRKSMEEGEFNCSNANVLFLTGLGMHELAKTLAPMALSCRFLDAWTLLRAPLILKDLAALEKHAIVYAGTLEKLQLDNHFADGIGRRLFKKWFRQKIGASDIIVAPANVISSFDPKAFKGKILLLDCMLPGLSEKLMAAGVQNIFYPEVLIAGSDKSYGYSVSEALIAIDRGQEDTLSQEDLLDYYGVNDVDARLMQIDRTAGEVPRKFAFVIHPLSRRDVLRYPLFKPVGLLPSPMIKKFEALLAKAPGLPYGRISGVRSEATGVHADGYIYFVGATPRAMLDAKPEAIYDRINGIAKMAAREGVKIIGLGAFTKIVGDAGVTIAAQSPIPVTTGNSLSAAATLWAAKEACRKMGFLKPLPGSDVRVQGTVMVIGATGSIGKACTSVLGASFNHIIIAAINAPRLMAYQEELKEMYPECRIQVTTEPARFASQCDLIVVSTSATEGGAFGLATVKPGCVICDVSRPLTFSAEEAMKRPDVLIIESGEIELPGNDIRIDCDLGLARGVVHACLAETALLALEGRYESFTLSRNINYRKVKEIYKIARKHGARLAEIRSPNGIITDQEIELCREHALRALEESEKAIG